MNPSLKAKFLSEVAREARAANDTEVIQLEFDDEELLKLCLQAHDRDMTLNEYIAMILERYMESLGDGSV